MSNLLVGHPEGRTVYASEFWGDDMAIQINNAIVYGLLDSPGKVIVPSGVWDVANSFGFDDREGIQIIGSGMGSTIIRPTSGLTGGSPVTGFGAKYCTLSNITFDGSQNATALVMIYADGTSSNPEYGWFTFRNISLINWTGKTVSSLNAGVGYTVAPSRFDNVVLPDQNLYFDYAVGNIPTAQMQLRPGTATAGTAPLKIPKGVVNTVPEDGALERDASGNWWITTNSTRTKIGDDKWISDALSDGIKLASGLARIGVGRACDAAMSILANGNIGARHNTNNVGVYLIPDMWSSDGGWAIGIGLNCHWDATAKRVVVPASQGSSGACLIATSTTDGSTRFYVFPNNGNTGYSVSYAGLASYEKAMLDYLGVFTLTGGSVTITSSGGVNSTSYSGAGVNSNTALDINAGSYPVTINSACISDLTGTGVVISDVSTHKLKEKTLQPTDISGLDAHIASIVEAYGYKTGAEVQDMIDDSTGNFVLGGQTYTGTITGSADPTTHAVTGACSIRL